MGWGCLAEIAGNRASTLSGWPKKNGRIGVELTSCILRTRGGNQGNLRELG